MRYSNHACPLISKDHYVNYPGRKEDFDEFSKSGGKGRSIFMGHGIVSASSRARKTITRGADVKKHGLSPFVDRRSKNVLQLAHSLSLSLSSPFGCHVR